MTNPTCKDCPDRHPICHDSCPKYAEYKRQLKAQRIYTNGNHAAERISRNDFNKEGYSLCILGACAIIFALGACLIIWAAESDHEGVLLTAALIGVFIVLTACIYVEGGLT